MSRVFTGEQDAMRVLVEKGPDGMLVSKRQQSAIVEYANLLGDSLSLLENMARDDDGLAL